MKLQKLLSIPATCGSVMPCDAALHWWYIIYLQQRYAMWCCLTLMIYYIPAAALCHVMLPYTDDILYTCSTVMPCDDALHWWYIIYLQHRYAMWCCLTLMIYLVWKQNLTFPMLVDVMAGDRLNSVFILMQLRLNYQSIIFIVFIINRPTRKISRLYIFLFLADLPKNICNYIYFYFPTHLPVF